MKDPAQGILGKVLKETRQNMILSLAVNPDIPKTSYNISKVRNMVGIKTVQYKLTRDLKFLNICFRLVMLCPLSMCASESDRQVSRQRVN